MTKFKLDNAMQCFDEREQKTGEQKYVKMLNSTDHAKELECDVKLLLYLTSVKRVMNNILK